MNTTKLIQNTNEAYNACYKLFKEASELNIDINDNVPNMGNIYSTKISNIRSVRGEFNFAFTAYHNFLKCDDNIQIYCDDIQITTNLFLDAYKDTTEEDYLAERVHFIKCVRDFISTNGIKALKSSPLIKDDIIIE